MVLVTNLDRGLDMTSFTARWCALAALGFEDQDCRYILGGMNDSVAFFVWENYYV